MELSQTSIYGVWWHREVQRGFSLTIIEI